MALFCLASDIECGADGAVQVLSDIYGSKFIGMFVTGGVPATADPLPNELAPVILGGLASVAGMLAFVVFFCLMFTALIKSAQDGEALGKGSAKSVITFRFAFSIIMLMPTASGYSICQVVLMFFVLWSNGETNKIYNNIVSASVLAQLGQASDESFNPAKGRDVFNVRGAALAHFAQAYCYNLINANYYQETYAPAVATNNATLSPESQISSIYVAEGNPNGVRATPPQTQVLEGKAGSLYTVSIVDAGGKIADNGNRAVCGAIKVYTPNPQDTEEMQYESSGRNAALGLSLEEQRDLFASIAEINKEILFAKKRIILQATADITNWMAVQSNIPYDYSAGDPAYATALAQVDYTGLETVIKNAVQKGDQEFTRIAENRNLNQLLQKLTTALVQKGWTYAGGIKQRIISSQSSVSTTTARETIEFTRPQLQFIQANDERLHSFEASIQAMDSVIERMLGTAAFMAKPTIVNVADKIPTKVTENTSSEEVTNKVLNDYTSVFGSLRRMMVSYILTGQASKDPMSGRADEGRATVSWLDDDRDVLANIQRTGELLAVTNGIVSLSFERIKVASLVAMGVAGTFDTPYRIAYSINRAIMDVVAPIVTKILTYMHVLQTYMAVVIPSMPYFFFITGVVAWYVHILQAMAGLPFWAIMHMIPEKSFVGSQTQGYVTVISLFLRPMLTLTGLFFGFILANPILLFVTDAFFAMQESLLTSNGSYVGSLTQFAAELFTFFNWLFVYCTLMLQICYMIFGLAGTLPDTVLRWLGSGLNAGGWGESNAQTALDSGAKSSVEATKLGAAAKKGAGDKSGGGGGGGDSGGGGGGKAPESGASPVAPAHGQGGVDAGRSTSTPAISASGAGGQLDTSSRANSFQANQNSYMESGGIVGSNGKPLDNSALWQANKTRSADAAYGFKRDMATGYGVGGAIGFVKGLGSGFGSAAQGYKNGEGVLGKTGGAIGGYFKGLGASTKEGASKGANIAGNHHFAKNGGVPIQTADGGTAYSKGGGGQNFASSYMGLRDAKNG